MKKLTRESLEYKEYEKAYWYLLSLGYDMARMAESMEIFGLDMDEPFKSMYFPDCKKLSGFICNHRNKLEKIKNLVDMLI